MEEIIAWVVVGLSAVGMLGGLHRFVWGSLMARFKALTDTLEAGEKDLDELRNDFRAEQVNHTTIQEKLEALTDLAKYQHGEVKERFDKSDKTIEGLDHAIEGLVQNTGDMSRDVSILQTQRAGDREHVVRIEKKAETITDIELNLAAIREFLEFKSLPKKRRGVRDQPESD